MILSRVALDTSAVIASFAAWHEHHQSALAFVRGAELIGHCAFETVSTLSRMPEPHRIDTPVIAEYLRRQFPNPWVTLDDAGIRGLVERLPKLRISGGAVYDALIATTALAHEIKLISCDHRAASTYERVGVRVEFIG